jgi:N-acetylglucosaminyl-diphospho-decaprenol L-rhamnosyltransferase
VQLTISIASVGDQALLIPCLESIQSETTVEYEIYVVFNLASPAFIDDVTDRFPQVRVINHAERHSFAENHNDVLQRSQSDFVLLLNDDTVILDHAIDRMVEFFEGQSRQVGIVGCTNLDDRGEFTLSCYPFPSAGVIVWQHAQLRRWWPGRVYERYLRQAQGTRPFPADWVKGSCVMIRCDVIQKIGYLDENFFLFSEEIDYCYRARQTGFWVYQVPRARILHYESATTSRFVPLKLRGHYMGKLHFLAKHGFRRDLRLVRAWFIAELAAKSAVRGLGAITGHPPDARQRLQTYWDLIRICVDYQEQTPSEAGWPGDRDACVHS